MPARLPVKAPEKAGCLRNKTADLMITDVKARQARPRSARLAKRVVAEVQGDHELASRMRAVEVGGSSADRALGARHCARPRRRPWGAKGEAAIRAVVPAHGLALVRHSALEHALHALRWDRHVRHPDLVAGKEERRAAQREQQHGQNARLT